MGKKKKPTQTKKQCERKAENARGCVETLAIIYEVAGLAQM